MVLWHPLFEGVFSGHEDMWRTCYHHHSERTFCVGKDIHVDVCSSIMLYSLSKEIVSYFIR